ncbi:hypothetical protein R6Q57_008077 [Mikania cordata]
MTKGSKASGQSASVSVAMAGYAVVVPSTTTVVSGGGKGGYETKTTVSYGDKQSGSYGRATATEKASTGNFHWKNGTSGTRSEYKESSTVRVGDKSGYTEVHSEQRVRNVTYEKSGSSSSKTYYNEAGGSYGGYGYGSGY